MRKYPVYHHYCLFLIGGNGWLLKSHAGSWLLMEEAIAALPLFCKMALLKVTYLIFFFLSWGISPLKTLALVVLHLLNFDPYFSEAENINESKKCLSAEVLWPYNVNMVVT